MIGPAIHGSGANEPSTAMRLVVVRRLVGATKRENENRR